MGSINQTIFSASEPFSQTINIRHASPRHLGDLVRHLVDRVIRPPSSVIPIGIACHTSPTGGMDFLSLANTTTAFLVTFAGKVRVTEKEFAALLFAGGEAPGDTCLVGFAMAPTAVQVSDATHLRVRGIDLSTLHSPDMWSPRSPVDIVSNSISSKIDKWNILSLWLGDQKSASTDVCMQAWLAACVGTKCQAKLASALKVDTRFINVLERDFFVEMISQSHRLESHKPKDVPNDFSKVTVNKSGKVELVNSRFKTRIRRSEQTRVVMIDTTGRQHVGDAQSAKGKTTTIKMQGQQSIASDFHSVRVIGRQEPTNSERGKDEMIHLVLTGRKELRESPFIRAFYFPKWKETKVMNHIYLVDFTTTEKMTSTMELNKSQRCVVHAMASDMPVVVAHGPPGTGKTTTIGAASRIWSLHQCPTWIVAHSNVAVKNIAETLFKNKVDFKILVSKEFYEEWHEHLYGEIEKSLIRSDELPKDSYDMRRLVGDSHIILCTLSMLSNPMLHDNGTFKIVPMERLIIDEASQINVFEYVHILVKFQGTLGKVCFFGDPMQLPPFGKTEVPSMKTVFDLPHISDSNRDFFLDTQYRMPFLIGEFISKTVYSGRLRSEHSIKGAECVIFIDVAQPRGVEERVGFSWKNNGEIQSIVHLVKNYYRHKNFCIITPYDGQRTAIQKALEAEKLPWESVFNLDSFQGNEADYILISVVRSGNHPGFLVSLNRMNVLLTRCKKAMILVTSRFFLARGGSNTLLGRLAAHWDGQYSPIWIDWRLVADGTADLPDALGPHRSKSKPVRAQSSHLHELVLRSAPPPQIPALYRSQSGGFSVSSLFTKKPVHNVSNVWNISAFTWISPQASTPIFNPDLDNYPPLRSQVISGKSGKSAPEKYSLVSGACHVLHHTSNQLFIPSATQDAKIAPKIHIPDDVWISARKPVRGQIPKSLHRKVQATSRLKQSCLTPGKGEKSSSSGHGWRSGSMQNRYSSLTSIEG